MKNNSEMLGKLPIPKLLIKIGIPAMIGMLITALYNLVDAAFVSGLGASQLGAISVTFPIGQLVVALGLLFGSGGSSYISRLLGEGREKRASSVASVTVLYSLGVGIFVVVLINIFLEKILVLLGATETILMFALSYASIYIFSSIFNVFNVTMTNIVASEGQAKISVFANLLGAGLNVIFDPIFIYVLKFGVRGAAIATAISQAIATIIYIRYILSGRSALKISHSYIKFDKEINSEILKIGVPTFIFQILTSVSICLINIMAKPYGDAAIASMGAVSRVLTVGNLVVFGFTKGFQPIAGFNYSAKKYERLNEATKTVIIWTGIFCLGFAAMLMIFPVQIISVFSKGNIEIIEIGSAALRANGFSFLFFGYYTVYQMLFLALGRAREGGIIGISRQGLFFIPLICILPLIWGIDGIVYAQPIANILATVLAVILYIGLRKKIQVMQSENKGVSGGLK